MTVESGDDLSQWREDPLYAEGMTHLQSGEWQRATECFEALQGRFGDLPPIQRALDEARFKARLDEGTHVRAKRWVLPGRAILLRVVVIVVVLGAGWQVLRILNQQVAPALAMAQKEQRIAQGVNDGNRLLEARDADGAEARFRAVLAESPGNADAQAGLEKVKTLREILAVCADAEGLFQKGDLVAARQKFTELSLRAPGACDANVRITEITRRLQREDLFVQAEAAYTAGQCADAVQAYQQVRQLDLNYKRDVLDERLFDCYVRLGQAMIQQDPPAPEQAPNALDYFEQALAIRPRDLDAANEQRLASLFIAGNQAYQAGRWDDTIARLAPIYEARPDYLGSATVNPLYDAYIRSGDALFDAADYYLAWEQYRRAADLPVDDNTLAQGRMAKAQPFLTPTPTPTNTPTITPLPTAAPYQPPTPIPSATPPAPLASYKNQIVFISAKDDQPGFWVMDPDGTNRRYLGEAEKVQEQYNALLEQDRLSPDGRFRVYVTTGESDTSAQIYIQGLEKDQFGNLPTWQVTHFAKVAYDPVWAPDGSRIAFVSQDQGSDDVFVINPDGTDPWNYTRNKWEWDKHPTWSPDSRKIAFWSNREGTRQIYVMDANGRNLVKISNTTWDEYDPLWIK